MVVSASSGGGGHLQENQQEKSIQVHRITERDGVPFHMSDE
jgi:hypothetical protein